MSKEIEILPSTVRVDNISIDHFMSDFLKIIADDPDLTMITVTGVSLSIPGGSMSLGRVSESSFNISSSVPQILQKLIEKMRKFYEKKQKP